jgi:hypothetical protein
MSSDQDVLARLIAHVKALLPSDWAGRAGQQFRSTMAKISRFASERELRPQDLVDQGISLGRKKIQGVASLEHSTSEKNYAEAARGFAEAEEKKLTAELKRRALESQLTEAEATARRAIAEARLAEAKALDAEIELMKKLSDAGIILQTDDRGDIIVVRKPNSSDRTTVSAQKELPGTDTGERIRENENGLLPPE